MSPQKKTAVLNGHGMANTNLHQFHLSEDAKCRCENEYQSMDHILFECEELNAQREVLKEQMETWSARKEDLINKYKKIFYEYIESIDFDNLIV